MADNPIAFPAPEVRSSNGEWLWGPEPGMTLRDWFAGQALAGLIGRAWADANGVIPPDIFTKWASGAYATADAMLAARGA